MHPTRRPVRRLLIEISGTLNSRPSPVLLSYRSIYRRRPQSGNHETHSTTKRFGGNGRSFTEFASRGNFSDRHALSRRILLEKRRGATEKRRFVISSCDACCEPSLQRRGIIGSSAEMAICRSANLAKSTFGSTGAAGWSTTDGWIADSAMT